MLDGADALIKSSKVSADDMASVPGVSTSILEL